MNLYHLTPITTNAKLGPMAAIVVSRNSCPASCPLKGRGCYAETGHTRFAWARADSGIDLDTLCLRIRALVPRNFDIRLGVAGDLPCIDSDGERLDVDALTKICQAAHPRHVFAYTHKRLNADEVACVRSIPNLTVNLSANHVGEVDELLKTGLPVAVVVPEDAGHQSTLGGAPIRICPQQLNKSITCSTCRVCTIGNRQSVIAFRAHGIKKRMVSAAAGKAYINDRS